MSYRSQQVNTLKARKENLELVMPKNILDQAEGSLHHGKAGVNYYIYKLSESKYLKQLMTFPR